MTENDIKAVEYDVSKWPLGSFLKSWVQNKDIEEWDDFYSAMAEACLEATDGMVITEMKLQARLNICARHLEKQGWTAPPYPARPKRTGPTLASILADSADELGLVRKS